VFSRRLRRICVLYDWLERGGRGGVAVLDSFGGIEEGGLFQAVGLKTCAKGSRQNLEKVLSPRFSREGSDFWT